jgi:hypothetical protein
MLDVTVGEAQRHHNLTIFPLLAPGAPDLPYDLLADAVAAGVLTIGEVGHGSVPVLAAKNAGERGVLVLDGEQLIGARQNRMTNRSILLPAHSQTEIPVYCMEQGRWHFDGDVMESAPQHSPAKVRRRARDTEVRASAGGDAAPLAALREAQGEVWSDVMSMLEVMGGTSSTGALDAAYAANAARLDDWLAAFPLEDGQVGLLAFVGDAALGTDLIGAARLYERLHERLLRGYIMDALERWLPGGGERTASAAAGASAGSTGPAADRAQQFLDAVRGATRTPAATVGAGTYNVLSGAVVGGELLDDGRVAHLSAFPPLRPASGGSRDTREGSPVAPPSRRRGHH